MQKHLFVFLSVALLLSVGALGAARSIQPTTIGAVTHDVDIVDLIQQVNHSLLFRYHNGLMKFGPRYTGSISCNLAANYIYDMFDEMMLPVQFHEWRYGGFTSRNVVATLQGTDTQGTVEYIVCGHYDTVADSPGANDDGSGTAAVLAIAHVLSHHQFTHTIRFITFSGEEVGTYGSFIYAREAYHRGDNIVAVLNMDMIAYANTPDGERTLRFFCPPRSTWIGDYASNISQKYNHLIDLTVDILPNYRGADHQAFVDYGYDGVWIAHQDGYPWGHSPEDTADRLNWPYYLKATKLMLAITAEIAQKPIDVQVLLQRPFEGTTYVFNHPAFESAFGRQWVTGLRGLTIILGGRTMASAEVISNEPVKYVIFCINGNFMSWDSQPPYEWRIQGAYVPLIGKNTLQVYAYTTSGKVAYDEMDIFIISRSTAH